MSSNEVTISISTFVQLVESQEKLNLIKRFWDTDGYMSRQTFNTIMGIAGGEDDEEA